MKEQLHQHRPVEDFVIQEEMWKNFWSIKFTPGEALVLDYLWGIEEGLFDSLLEREDLQTAYGPTRGVGSRLAKVMGVSRQTVSDKLNKIREKLIAAGIEY